MTIYGNVKIGTYIEHVDKVIIISEKHDAIIVRTTEETVCPTEMTVCATEVTDCPPQESKPQTEESPVELKEQLTRILLNRKSGVQLFCVLKGMIEAGVASNLKDAEQQIRALYPEGVPGKDYDMHEIESRMNSLSFTKKIDEWDANNCPLKRTTTFQVYQDTARAVRDIFSKKKDLGQG